MAGRGTKEAPYAAIVKHIVNALISTPRVNAETLKKLESRGAKNINRKGLDTLLATAGIKFRVSLPMMKHPASATAFLDVWLKEKGRRAQSQFQSEISKIRGVIEWDAVKGIHRDYLVRVVNAGDDDVQEIRDGIAALRSVERVSMSEIDIIASGIVDHFYAEDFFIFKLDSFPPRDEQT